MSTLRANELKKLDDTNWVGTNPTQVPTNDMIGEQGFEQAVDSVAALRLATFPASLERLWLSGYYGVGTSGGGPLYRDSADTVSADNGGTVFVDGGGVRWKRAVDGAVSVTWFGAGDESVVADSTAAIQSAIDYSKNDLSKTVDPHQMVSRRVEFGAGDIYVITQPIETYSFIELDGNFCSIKSVVGLDDVFFLYAGDAEDNAFRQHFKFLNFNVWSDLGYNNSETRIFNSLFTIRGGWAKFYEIGGLTSDRGANIQTFFKLRVIGDGEGGVSDWGYIHDIDGQNAWNTSCAVAFEGDKLEGTGFHRCDNIRIERIHGGSTAFAHDYSDPTSKTHEQGAIIVFGDFTFGYGPINFAFSSILTVGAGTFRNTKFFHVTSESTKTINGVRPFALKGKYFNCSFDLVRMYFRSTNSPTYPKVLDGEFDKCVFERITLSDQDGNIAAWEQMFFVTGKGNVFKKIGRTNGGLLPPCIISTNNLFGDLDRAANHLFKTINNISLFSNEMNIDVATNTTTPIYEFTPDVIGYRVRNSYKIKVISKTKDGFDGNYRVRVTGLKFGGSFNTGLLSASAEAEFYIYPSPVNTDNALSDEINTTGNVKVNTYDGLTSSINSLPGYVIMTNQGFTLSIETSDVTTGSVEIDRVEIEVVEDV